MTTFNKLTLSEFTKYFEEYFENPKNVKKAQEYFKNIKDKEDREDESFKRRFHPLSVSEKKRVIDLWEKKYSSPAYVLREYKIGYEPREPLSRLLFNYCAEHGEEVNDYSYFSAGTFVLKDVCRITRYNGQGTIYRVTLQ